jgi:hypothetical protein
VSGHESENVILADPNLMAVKPNLKVEILVDLLLYFLVDLLVYLTNLASFQRK